MEIVEFFCSKAKNLYFLYNSATSNGITLISKRDGEKAHIPLKNRQDTWAFYIFHTVVIRYKNQWINIFWIGSPENSSISFHY